MTTPTTQPGPVGLSPWRLGWRRFRASRMAMAGAILVTVMVATGLFAPLLAPYAYDREFRDDWNAGPSAKHWLGVDPLSRDALSRVVYGARVSLQVAVAATAVSVVIGVAVGALAGYLGGWTDELLMRTADTFSAFPGILLAVVIMAAMENRSLMLLFLVLGLVGWPGLARIVRSQVLSLREEDFVKAARALGARRRRIILRHILPNCTAAVLVTATVLMAGNILGEAGAQFSGHRRSTARAVMGQHAGRGAPAHHPATVDVPGPRHGHRLHRPRLQPPRRRPPRRARPQVEERARLA